MRNVIFSAGKYRGFTLLEVLVAFSLLSILFALIIQSQADAIYFLEKTGKLALAQKEVMNELLKIERNLAAQTVSTETGVFPDDHPLHGSQWRKDVVMEDFLDIIKIKKITYRITWQEGKTGAEQFFESAILGEIR